MIWTPTTYKKLPLFFHEHIVHVNFGSFWEVPSNAQYVKVISCSTYAANEYTSTLSFAAKVRELDVIGEWFEICSVALFSRLNVLRLPSYYNCVFDTPCVFPHSLQTLYLGSDYTQVIPPHSLPPFLQELHCGKRFYNPFANDVIPSTLSWLEVHSCDVLTNLPPSLQKLDLHAPLLYLEHLTHLASLSQITNLNLHCIMQNDPLQLALLSNVQRLTLHGFYSGFCGVRAKIKPSAFLQELCIQNIEVDYVDLNCFSKILYLDVSCPVETEYSRSSLNSNFIVTLSSLRYLTLRDATKSQLDSFLRRMHMPHLTSIFLHLRKDIFKYVLQRILHSFQQPQFVNLKHIYVCKWAKSYLMCGCWHEFECIKKDEEEVFSNDTRVEYVSHETQLWDINAYLEKQTKSLV